MGHDHWPELARIEQLRLRNEADPDIRAERPDPTKHAEYLVVRRERLSDWVRAHVQDDQDPPGFYAPDHEDEVWHLSDYQVETLARELEHREAVESEPQDPRSPAEPSLEASSEAPSVGASPGPEAEPPPGPEGR